MFLKKSRFNPFKKNHVTKVEIRFDPINLLCIPAENLNGLNKWLVTRFAFGNKTLHKTGQHYILQKLNEIVTINSQSTFNLKIDLTSKCTSKFPYLETNGEC